MECYKEVAQTVYSELSRSDVMSKYTTDYLLQLDNESLYNVYLEGVKNKDLPVICSCRSIIADRYCISELKKSPLDNPFNNPAIQRFFTVK